MSKELIRIIEEMNHKELNTQLALQCAPLLTGNKLSNLLIVDISEKNKVIKMFRNTGLSLFILFQTETRVTFLLYRRCKLVKHLHQTDVKELMIKLGYSQYELRFILMELKARYQYYMQQKEAFPHELGLILEYPVKDVIGFMENQGKNFLYTGYWKVYHNLPNALEVFERYTQAREMVLRMVLEGFPILQILEQYYPESRLEQVAG